MSRSNSSTNDCDNWLAESIDRMRQSLGSTPAHGSEVRGLQDEKIIRAAVAGDVKVLLQLIEALPNAAETGDPTAGSSVLTTVINDIERRWKSDALSFDEVLHGFWTLRRAFELRVARDKASKLGASPASIAEDDPILLATVPGCEHVFGVLSLADQFSARGIHVDTCLDATRVELLDRVASKPYQLIGLSVGGDEQLVGVADLILDIRARLGNSSIPVLLGGNVFVFSEEEYGWLGADRVLRTVDEALNFVFKQIYYNRSANDDSALFNEKI
jgi:methylmalonyl-CoA mutase cobalamin-binding subunit